MKTFKQENKNQICFRKQVAAVVWKIDQKTVRLEIGRPIRRLTT